MIETLLGGYTKKRVEVGELEAPLTSMLQRLMGTNWRAHYQVVSVVEVVDARLPRSQVLVLCRPNLKTQVVTEALRARHPGYRFAIYPVEGEIREVLGFMADLERWLAEPEGEVLPDYRLPLAAIGG
jgi:hypothetical protein